MTLPDRWTREFRVGRLRVMLTVLKHRYPTSADRWVVQTSTVYDRKDGRCAS